MSAAFDPYHKWLGIPPAEQPPHHYRLLGLAPFEQDADVIEIAADQRMALLRSFHTGPHSDLSQRLLNEVAAARLCLLKPDRRQRYDEVLRARLGQEKQPATAFDLVHERKTQSPAARSPAPAPPPVSSLAATTPADSAAAAVKPPLPLPLEGPAKMAAKPPPVIKTTSDLPKAAATLKGTGDPAKTAPAASDAIELIGKTARKTREIELAPRSSDWDRAISEACSTQSVVHRRRRRWRVSQSLIQFAIGASLIAGLFYGGAVGFRMWQDYDAKRVNEASVAKKPHPLPAPDVSTTVTAPAESKSNESDSSANQPEIQRTEAPNFGSRRPNDTRPSPDERDPRNSTGQDTSHDPPSAPGPSLSGSQTSGRQPVPDAAAQKKAGAEIDDILKLDYQAAAGSSHKLDLAKTLTWLARETNDDPTKRYVLDDRALTMATNFGDVELAAQIVRDMIANFQVNPWELRISALNKLARVGGSPMQRASIARGALPLIDDAMADERFDIALELADLSVRMAGFAKDITLRDQAHDALERIKTIQKRHAGFEAANYRLATNPDDPDANLTVGKFKSFVRQDWHGGLPHLAKSADGPLRGLAERDLKAPTEPADQLALADAWFELAAERSDAKNDLEAKAMRLRAAYWYHESMHGLSGISLEKARRRLDVQ